MYANIKRARRMQGFTSQMLQLASKMEGSSSKMLHIACEKERSNYKMLHITCKIEGSSSKMPCIACEKERPNYKMLQITCKIEGSSSKMQCIACKMKGSSSKMLQMTCKMEDSSSQMLQITCKIGTTRNPNKNPKQEKNVNNFLPFLFDCYLQVTLKDRNPKDSRVCGAPCCCLAELCSCGKKVLELLNSYLNESSTKTSIDPSSVAAVGTRD